MSKHICVYCKKEKNESDFNREHVVPRMMGTYENGFALSNFEVCEDCNSYFSRELENKIGLNSMESFLRIQHGRPMSDGRGIKKDRLSFSGTEGVFKGLDFTPVVDSNNEEKMHFDISPKIGILSSDVHGGYDYFDIDNLPDATKEKNEFLNRHKNGIVSVGISQSDAVPYLLCKGYLDKGYEYPEVQISELYPDDSFTTQIRISIDSIVRRTCAKTVFNYLCYCEGKEYVLSNNFNAIREYISYGTWSDDLWFRYSTGPVTSVTIPNDSAHVVGYMLYPEGRNWTLCGCLTWFGELTYVFKLGYTEQNVSQINILASTKMACFDNVDKKITEEEAVYLFAKKQSN